MKNGFIRRLHLINYATFRSGNLYQDLLQEQERPP